MNTATAAVGGNFGEERKRRIKECLNFGKATHVNADQEGTGDAAKKAEKQAIAGGFGIHQQPALAGKFVGLDGF